MVQQAQSHADEDRRKREAVDARNQADTLAYQLEKLAQENREKLGDVKVREIEQAVAEARKAMEGEDAAAIHAAAEKLKKVSHDAAESLYKAAGSGSGGPQEKPEAERSPDGDVVDAEYTVKN